MKSHKKLLAALCVSSLIFGAQGAFAAPEERSTQKTEVTAPSADAPKPLQSVVADTPTGPSATNADTQSSTTDANVQAGATATDTNTQASKDAQPKTAGMKNPLHLCQTVNEANKILGYRPLYVPRIYGYEVDKIYVIGDAMAQLTFISNIDDSTLIVRTAVIEEVGTDEISGYYGVNWQERPMSRSHTLYGTTQDGKQIVSWVEGRYAFSVICTNLDEQTFMRQMKGLVRTSEQRYNRRARQ